MAEANLDINGRMLRAQVAAGEMKEAVDLLQHRLADRLEHRAERLKARRRQPGRAEGREWQHGDVSTTRPEYHDRPVEERQIIRRKELIAAEQSVDEAIFDMDQCDYDFHVFRDLESGEDSMVERSPNRHYLLQHLRQVAATPSPGAYNVAVIDTPAPTLTVDEAVVYLDAGGPRVFFASAVTGHGNVLYRRYDGHYGLITLEPPESRDQGE